jgi:hypothetical protein
MHPHLYELDYVKAAILQHHENALTAERLRTVTDTGIQPGLIATLMGVRDRIACAMTSAMARLTRMPRRATAPSSGCAPAQR